MEIGQTYDAFATSQRRADRLYTFIEWLARRLRVEVDGLEHLPPGRALLVGNHAFRFRAALASCPSPTWCG
ncbi:MAG TPA: hypothetical protein VK550_05185 [Polyangiaceae bacterium]|nr:hypothetical protein [Polyangiaceae bacterium]